MYLSDSRTMVVRAEKAGLVEAIQEFMDRAFPRATQATWDNSGSRATVQLAEGVTASVSITVGDVYPRQPGMLRVSTQAWLQGQGVTNADRDEAKRFFDAVANGLELAVSGYITGRRPNYRVMPRNLPKAFFRREGPERGVA